MNNKLKPITFYHTDRGINDGFQSLEIDVDYIGEIFQSQGVDYRDKQKDEVIEIWRELDGLEYKSDSSWEEISIMLSDFSKEGDGYYKRLESMEWYIFEEIDGLITKHGLKRWEYHSWEDYEEGSIWYR